MSTGLLQLPSQARHTLCTHAGRIRTVSTRASSSSPVRLATRSVHTQGGYALWAHGPPPAPQSGSPHALHTHREDTHCGHTGLLQLPSQAIHTLCTHAGRIRTVSTRASSSSPVRLATRSVHTQGGYALWAHGPPPAPQSGSPHALHTHREDTHCGHTGLLQLPSQARHTLCTHAGRIRTVSTRASSSPVRLATRSVHTQGGYALWAHGPPPAPQSGSPALCTHAGRIRTVGTRASSSSPVRLATRSAHTQGGYAQWAHGPPPARVSGSPHALTHAGRIRTVGTRASSSSPVRLATRSVHTQGGYALWAHGPPPAPQSGSPHALHTRREDTHCGQHGPPPAPQSGSPHALYTQGGYALWAHGPPPAPQSGSPHALYTRREDTHCGHTGPSSSPVRLATRSVHTCGRIRTVSTRACSSSPVRLATRSAHTQGGYAL